MLPIVCCDLILGVQWLKLLGKIMWDFANLQMELSVNGQKCILRSAETPSTKLINSEKFTQNLHDGAQVCFLYVNQENPTLELPKCQLFSIEVEPVSLPHELQLLISEFADILLSPQLYLPNDLGLITKFQLCLESLPS